MSKETLDGHKPLAEGLFLQLTEEQIFCSPHHFALTVYGSRLQGLCITYDSLYDPKTTPDRRLEIDTDINKRCQELGISRSKIPELKAQLFPLVRNRADRLSTLTVDKRSSAVTMNKE